ncbi:probable serine protease EDA2 [Selaginella moellendorffii]|uniref:probable serine protease EDA2 n=1 Tax=Selaginella moellendorffii TaxID=88036 RepID=UPI000D1CA83E|nr:probable serine protease EDA2 [Selaginella moellendorffii]|eukprot:XP_024537539.1 probable serine protease EDA2 [Selaginella moellendorffii]
MAVRFPLSAYIRCIDRWQLLVTLELQDDTRLRIFLSFGIVSIPAACFKYQQIEDSRVFSQRYFEFLDYFQPQQGPIFLALCGESTCGGGYQRTAVGALAKSLGAVVVTIEHRYYGQSYPFQNFSYKNLKYLTTQQALYDYALFIDYYENLVNLQYNKQGKNPWIVVGGSYAGALSAWFRLKFPHLVVASWASSGVVEAVLEYSAYDEQLRDDDFLSLVADIAAGFMAYARIGGVDSSSSDSYDAYELRRQAEANDISAKDTMSWNYQICTELAYFQVAPTNDSIRSSRSRIIFLNGSQDPWQHASKTTFSPGGSPRCQELMKAHTYISLYMKEWQIHRQQDALASLLCGVPLSLALSSDLQEERHCSVTAPLASPHTLTTPKFPMESCAPIRGADSELSVERSRLGALTAWFGLKFPDLVVASWASSGVIKAVLEYSAYDEQLNDVDFLSLVADVAAPYVAYAGRWGIDSYDVYKLNKQAEVNDIDAKDTMGWSY